MGHLFKKALEQNRPSFVDYILRCSYDPRNVANISVIDTAEFFKSDESIETINRTTVNSVSCQQFIVNLYNFVRHNAHEVSLLILIFRYYRSEKNIRVHY